jgi:hypothetical protein
MAMLMQPSTVSPPYTILLTANCCYPDILQDVVLLGSWKEMRFILHNHQLLDVKIASYHSLELQQNTGYLLENNSY